MTTRPSKSAFLGSRGQCAFSLVEILVTVALLSVIILGLVAMFNQTRRAFTSSMTQVDVLESGRSAADLIARDLEEITPAGSTRIANLAIMTPLNYDVLQQTLADPLDFKTNNMQEIYFLTRYNQQWNILGYKVMGYTNGIGTLCRFSQNGLPTATLVNLLLTNNINLSPLHIFTNATTLGTNFSRLVDGVVSFRIRTYDSGGMLYPALKFTNNTGVVLGTLPYRSRFVGSSLLYTNSLNTAVISIQNFQPPDYTAQFYGSAIPSYVEVELGVLEDRAFAHWQSLTNSGTAPGTLAWTYLQNHAGQVHVFRQRVAIRGADPTVYQ